MSPPPAPKHGNFQSEIAQILRSSLSAGRVVTECPLLTSDGVKAIDVAWLARGRAQELRSMTCLVRAPEICADVISASNTSAEMSEKIALYFEARAQEVWTCDEDGTMESIFLRRRKSGRSRPFVQDSHQASNSQGSEIRLAKPAGIFCARAKTSASSVEPLLLSCEQGRPPRGVGAVPSEWVSQQIC
jgi:Uma2 family endonuclease